MKIQLDNGVVIVPTISIREKIQSLIFEAAGIVELPVIKKKYIKVEKPELPAVGKPKKSKFTENEQENIIQLYNLGEMTHTIAKKFDKPSAWMSNYLWNLKKKGLITDRKAQNAPDSE